MDGGSLKWLDHEQQWLQALEQRRGGDGAAGKREGRRGKGYGGACVPCLGTAVEEEREPRLKQQRQRELRSASMADALWRARAAQRAREAMGRRERRRVRKAGCPFKRAQRRWDARRHGAGRWGAAALHGGHAAFHRTHVVRGSGWRGTRFWACSGLI